MFNSIFIDLNNHPIVKSDDLLSLKLSADTFDYVDQISDLHPPSDIGSHTNFNNLKDFDDNWDSIQEGLIAPLGRRQILNVSGFNSDDLDWVETGSSPYLDSQDNPTNIISTSSNNAIEGLFDFDDETDSYSDYGVVLYAYCKNDDGSSNDYFEVYRETGGAPALLGSIHPDTTYDWYTINLGLLSDSVINAYQIEVKYIRVGGSDDVYIDYIYLNITGFETGSYDMDLEMGWTSADFDEVNEELCIYADMSEAEAIIDDFGVDVWDGFEYINVISALHEGWNNVSVSAYLTDATFEIRLIDEFDSDSQGDSYGLDCILLHTWSPEAEGDEPTWDTLTESADPLELGNNETIHINIYDASGIDFVYLEFDGDNHSMNFESGNTYNYTNWLPISLGVKDYQIHMIDEFGNTNQTGVLNITVILPITEAEDEAIDFSVVNVLIMSLMMIIQSFYYFKVSIKSMIRLPIMLTTSSFSLLMTPLLMMNEVPATPFIQMYFILYQVVMFFTSVLEYKLIKNG